MIPGLRQRVTLQVASASLEVFSHLEENFGDHAKPEDWDEKKKERNSSVSSFVTGRAARKEP